jgi:transcriptional regulator with XRE-family HTH domain
MATLKEMRLRRMLTQKELAERVGVTYQSIQGWESGNNMPRPAAMRRLCEVLQVDPDELFDALQAGRAPEKLAA